MQHCKTYHDLVEDFLPSGLRIAINQGGTRSGKTYSTIQFLIETGMRAHVAHMHGRMITICRKTLPALKATALRDFIEILRSIGMYSEYNHNKTERTYTLFNTTFEFISLDEPTKVRGRKRDILFINEANECTYEDWRQLLLRTTDKIIIDFNPSDEFHWIYDNVCTRNDARLYVTTYKHNPFLEKEIIAEIERLQDEDVNYWNIYGLGLRGVSGATIYTHWKHCDTLPDTGERAYALDFGYNNPTALCLCVRTETALYAQQLLYKSHLTNNDLITHLKEIIKDVRTPLYCDSAEPDRIEELRRAGFNAKPAFKIVKLGIDKVKSFPLFITKDSVEGLKEIQNYKYKVDHNDKPIDEPVKHNDHFVDALRYCAYELNPSRKIKARGSTLV